MKKTLLIGIAALSMVAAAGVSIRLSANKEAVEVSAWDNGETYYYLSGKFGGEAHWTDYIAAPSDGTNVGVLMNQSLTAGDLFKFKVPEKWDGALTFDSFYASAGAYNAFTFEKGTDNVYCAVTGTYNFFIWDDSGSKKISVEFSDSYSASYSYVLTSSKDWGFSYLYMNANDQELRAWASAPAVSGQAYDIKFTKAEYEYKGLYRIDDRILSGWDRLIMKKADGSSQASTISRTAGNKQELYMVGASVATKAKSTDEYKAMEFLYDLVGHRGGANYDSHDFAFSICATSKADATRLVNAYDNFSSSIKTLLADAHLFTYNVEGEYGEADENKAWADIDDIVEALRIIASKPDLGGANRIVGSLENGTNTAVILAITFGGLSALALGGFFFMRSKRKSDR